MGIESCMVWCDVFTCVWYVWFGTRGQWTRTSEWAPKLRFAKCGVEHDECGVVASRATLFDQCDIVAYQTLFVCVPNTFDTKLLYLLCVVPIMASRARHVLMRQLKRPVDTEDEDECPSLTFVHGLSFVMQWVRDFPDSIGKQLLWVLFTTFICDHKVCCTQTQRLGLLSCRLCLFSGESGVAVFTQKHGQVNVNLLLPDVMSSSAMVLEEVRTFLQRNIPHVAIDTRSLRTHLLEEDSNIASHVDALAHFEPRRFVPRASWIANLCFDAETSEVVCDVTNVRIRGRVIPDAQTALRECPLPLSRASPDADESVEYWHRFPCGVIVSLKNRIVPAIASISLPPSVKPRIAIEKGILKPCCIRLINAIQTSCIDETLIVIKDSKVPMDIRRICVWRAQSKLGLSDDLILEATLAITDDPGPYFVISDMMAMGRVFLATRYTSWVQVGDMLTTVLTQCSDQNAWRAWMLLSKFVYKVIDELDAGAFRRLYRRFTPLRHSLSFLLHNKIGKWSQTDTQKAMILDDDMPPVCDKDPIHEVREELKRMCIVSEMSFKTTLHEEDTEDGAHDKQVDDADMKNTTNKKKKKKKKKQATSWHKGGDVFETTDDAPRASPRYGSHHDFAACIGKRVDMHAELIGSGVFSDMGDADVVLTLSDPNESLDDAYARVAKLLNLKACFDKVSRDHVAVLTGVLEGVKVDVQIWSGRVGCKAESETERALLLARRLALEADGLRRRHVRALHEIFHVAQLKSHRLCRVPGVAVTVLAIALSCHIPNKEADDEVDEHSERRIMVRALRTALGYESPCVCLTNTTGNGNTGRCLVPLQVYLEDETQCLATRLTACGTRHMLDAIAFASNANVWSPNIFSDWREQSMFVAAWVAPRDGDVTVSKTLHVALAKLDGHPIVDSVYVSEHTSACSEYSPWLCVRVTLQSSSETEEYRYGFRESDVVVRAPSLDCVESYPMALVRRGSREWPLAMSRRSQRCEATSGLASLRDVLGENSAAWCVPNAPYLTVDVVNCFDPRHWKHCCS